MMGSIYGGEMGPWYRWNADGTMTPETFEEMIADVLPLAPPTREEEALERYHASTLFDSTNDERVKVWCRKLLRAYLLVDELRSKAEEGTNK